MTNIANVQIDIDDKQKNKFNLKKLNWFLNSNWALFALTIIIAFCWLIDMPIISATIIVIFEALVFIFCQENPKAFLYPLIAIFFCPRTEINTPTLIYGAVLVAIFVGIFIAYLIVKIKKQNVKCKKGKLFWAFIPLLLVNFLGGVVGHFNIIMSLTASLFLIILYVAYWFCLNFVNKSQKYFAYCALFLTILISLEIFLSYFFTDNFFGAIFRKIDYFGIININCGSIIMLTGLCSCFYLATGNKRDYLFIILAVFFDLVILQNYSRIATFVAAIISIAYFIFVVIKSPHKKQLLIALGVVIVITAIVCGIMWKQIYAILKQYIDMKFDLNGREPVWNWCIESFKKSKFFGVGYTTSDPYVLEGNTYGMDLHGTFAFIHAHNLVLQKLTCIGIFGLLLSLPLYIQKYIILFKKFTTYKLFMLMLFISLLATGMFDPTYTTDFFLVLFCVCAFAMAENITYNNDVDEIDEEIKNNNLTPQTTPYNTSSENAKISIEENITNNNNLNDKRKSNLTKKKNKKSEKNNN